MIFPYRYYVIEQLGGGGRQKKILKNLKCTDPLQLISFEFGISQTHLIPIDWMVL